MPQELQIQTVQTKIKTPLARPVVPNPSPINLLDVGFIVITSKTIPSGTKWVYIALTPKQYENLSKNQAELLRFIRESRWRMQYYRGELKEIPNE